MFEIQKCKLLGIAYANSFLLNNSRRNFFEKLSKKKTREFFFWYLS